MSATMARKWGRVQLDQSNMHLTSHMAQMAKAWFVHTATEEMQFKIKKDHTKVREEKLQGVNLPGHRNVKAGIERHPAMVCEYQTYGCLPSQNGQAQNPQTGWTHKGTGTPAPEGLREPTLEPMPLVPRTPPSPTCDTKGAHSPHITGVPPGYVYIHTPLFSAQFFNLDVHAKDRKRDKDIIPTLLTDEGTFPG